MLNLLEPQGFWSLPTQRKGTAPGKLTFKCRNKAVGHPVVLYQGLGDPKQSFRAKLSHKTFAQYFRTELRSKPWHKTVAPNFRKGSPSPQKALGRPQKSTPSTPRCTV